MRNRIYAVILAVLVAAVGYLMVSTANAHTERDNNALLQWRYAHAVK